MSVDGPATLDASATPADPATLDAQLIVHRGAFDLDVTISVAAGEVVALLGPNGAGKTTVLRALAGLVPLDGGALHVGGVCWDSPADRVFVPPQHRGVGLVFQDYLLFPHLSTMDNIAFGLRCAGLPRRAARQAALTWLDRFGLAALAAAKPRHLSGGQAQRVALARALAVRPRLLLLDEPLAALDAATRQEVRASLRQHLTEPGPGAPLNGAPLNGAPLNGTPLDGAPLNGASGAAVDRATLLVTHDPLDAMVLADRIIVIEDGRVVQQGSASEITQHPHTEYVARLVGLNLYRGTSAGHLATVAADPDRVSGADDLNLATADSVHGPAFVAFAPSAVALYQSRPAGSPRNTWSATVVGLERQGDRVRVRLAGPLAAAADVTPAAVAELGLAPGTEVWAAVKAAETRAYPRQDPRHR